MKKFIIVIILLAIVWAIPEVRGRIGVALMPVFEKLGPVGDRMATPARRFSARSDLKFFLRIIGDDLTEGRPVPTEATFSTYIDRRMKMETGVDPWGNKYWLRRNGRRFTVGSHGQDGKRDTKDDLTETRTF